MKEKIIEFLTANGWTEIDNTEYDSEYSGFYKDGALQVDLNEEEIVLLGDIGDICHIPFNYFALIGALIHFRQLPLNFKDILI